MRAWVLRLAHKCVCKSACGVYSPMGCWPSGSGLGEGTGLGGACGEPRQLLTTLKPAPCRAAIHICKRPDGSDWRIGSGGFGTVRRGGVPAYALACLLALSRALFEQDVPAWPGRVLLLARAAAWLAWRLSIAGLAGRCRHRQVPRVGGPAGCRLAGGLLLRVAGAGVQSHAQRCAACGSQSHHGGETICLQMDAATCPRLPPVLLAQSPFRFAISTPPVPSCRPLTHTRPFLLALPAPSRPCRA